MVFSTNKKTFRAMVVATVACSVMLLGCASKDTTRDHVKINPKDLRAPIYNPQVVDGRVVQPEGARAPEGNQGLGTGSNYANPPSSLTMASADIAPIDEIAAAPAPVPVTAQSAPAQKEESGFFDWIWKDKPKANTAPDVTNAERKVPVLNYEGAESSDAILAPATYDAVATNHVDVNDASAVGFVPAEPASVAPTSNGNNYPSLSSVPGRPQRLDAVQERDQKLADLQNEFNTTVSQRNELNQQVTHDNSPASGASAAPTSLSQDGYAGIQGYGDEVQITPHNTAPKPVQQVAAPVAVTNVPVSQIPAAYAPNTGAQHAPAATYQSEKPVVMGAPAAPLSAPTNHAVTPQTEVVAVQENEWVDLRQDPAQQAIPVEGVEVASAPAVSSVPGAITLTPPSSFTNGSAIRSLPDSRYAARRQSLYKQQYSHLQARSTN